MFHYVPKTFIKFLDLDLLTNINKQLEANYSWQENKMQGKINNQYEINKHQTNNNLLYIANSLDTFI